MKYGFYVATCLLVLSGCGEAGRERESGVVQTGFPGQLSAGGSTSGAVMAQASGGTSGASMPAGTPGIPKGAEGNVGGTQMGGTAKAQTGGEAQANSPSSGTGGGEQAGTPVESAPQAPPVREGRGNTARDATSAQSSVPKGNVADSPPPAEQARKEKAK